MKTTAPIRVVLIEDDAPFRSYVAALLAATGRYQVAGSYGSAEAAMHDWPAPPPALVLLDEVLPGLQGGQAVERLLRLVPALRIVMLTARSEDAVILEAIRAGACGYLVKGASSDEVLDAVDTALAGGAPMSPGVARKVLELLRQAPIEPPSMPTAPLAPLTPREQEVLALVAEGLLDKEIAARLGTAVPTVKNHLASVYAKWRVRSRTEAAVNYVKQAGG
jgi:DNA-binding NarL/FixJ family response regulator